MTKHDVNFSGVETTMLDKVVEQEAKERAEAELRAKEEAERIERERIERERVLQEEVCYCSPTRGGMISR